MYRIKARGAYHVSQYSRWIKKKSHALDLWLVCWSVQPSDLTRITNKTYKASLSRIRDEKHAAPFDEAIQVLGAEWLQAEGAFFRQGKVLTRARAHGRWWRQRSGHSPHWWSSSSRGHTGCPTLLNLKRWHTNLIKREAPPKSQCETNYKALVVALWLEKRCRTA